MPIPRIQPYHPPSPPENVVTWTADPARAALLVHDMQRYFLDFFPPGEPVTSLVANVARLRDAAHACSMPVFYTAQPGDMTSAERGLLADFWGPGMRASAAERSIVDAVAPGPADTILTKWRYSAFHRSPLKDLLGDRDQLIVCGVYAHVGVLMTACDAFTRDIAAFLVTDAVADFSVDDHRLALDYAARRCAAVHTTDDVLAQLGATVRA